MAQLMEQISLFDVPEVVEFKEVREKGSGFVEVLKEEKEEVYVEDVLPFDVGESVQVIVPEESVDSEGHFYLKPYERKKGTVLRVIEEPVLYYELDFEGDFAKAYHSELEIGWP